MKRQRMYQKNSRPQPRACSAMESVCDFPQNCIRRAIFEIQVRLITQDIWQKTESWHSGRPRQGTISKWEVPRSRCLRRTRRRSASFPAERRVSGHKNQLWATSALVEGDAEKKRNNRSPGKARRPTSSKWPTMAARLLRSRNCWPRSIHGSRSYQWAYGMLMGIREGKFWNG
jgi:hypothetical protein